MGVSETGRPQAGELPRRLAVAIHSLAGGGAERTAARLASHWAALGVDVTLITLDSSERDSYPLNASVRRVGLGLMAESHSRWEAVRNNAGRLRALRRAIQTTGAPLVLSFTDKMNITTLLACIGLRVQIVACERTDPRQHNIGRTWSRLRQLLYRRCQGLVVQTAAVRDWSRALVRGRPVYVIPNAAFQPEATHPDGSAPDGRRRIVGLGRLADHKGFDLLLAAFLEVAGDHPDWILEIFGEGDQRPFLEQFRDTHQHADRILFPGWTDRPAAALSRGEIFVLPSRYEGFPNALLEAMACGLACISFDCDSGPREIIRPGVDGLLVPAADVARLASALDQLMRDDALRHRLGNRASGSPLSVQRSPRLPPMGRRHQRSLRRRSRPFSGGELGP